MKSSLVLRFVLGLGAAAAALAVPRAAAAACLVQTGDYDGNGSPDMRFIGSAGKQVVIIAAEPDRTVVSLDCLGNGNFTETGDLDAVPYPGRFQNYILGLGGNDVATFRIAAPWTGVSKSLLVVLEGSANQLNVEAAAGASLRAKSSLLVDVSGYLGADKLNVKLPDVDDSSVVLRSEMSFGDDEVRVSLGNVTGGAVVDLDSVLDLGNNRFVLDQPAGTTVSGTVLARVEGNAGADTVISNLDGAIDGGRVQITSPLGAGNDVFTAKLDLADFDILNGGTLRVDVDGGNGSDILTLGRNGTTGGAGSSLAGLLEVRFNGGADGDRLVVDLAGGGFRQNGTLSVRQLGGSGSDTLLMDADADAGASAPRFDLALLGGLASDTIRLKLDNAGPNTAANFGAIGSVLVDGGQSMDTCILDAGASPLRKRSCER